MAKEIRIGTRDSQLALWQANYCKDLLESHGYQCTIVTIKSKGELNLTSPLYEMGVQGIFTKSLDIALLNGDVDLVVHSLKDVPTQIAKGIRVAAIPSRGNSTDSIVYKIGKEPDLSQPLTIATSSLRRKAQWLSKYPHHKIVPIRGNINSRLRKLMEEEMDGVIFATAGIERINLEVPFQQELDWMLSAPSQGALGFYCREDDESLATLCQSFNDDETFNCTSQERMFLRTLGGGCSMPIAAKVTKTDNTYTLRGNIVNIEGTQTIEVEKSTQDCSIKDLGRLAALELLDSGARALIAEIKKDIDNV